MATAAIDSIEEAIEALYDLRVGVVGSASGERHERPHKPLLLLAVLDLIADGQATGDEIPWSRGLRDRFAAYFAVVRARDDRDTPEYPFHYLRNDAVWAAVEIVDGRPLPLRREPKVGECDTGRISAALTGGLDRYVLTPTNRSRLRDALVARYFPAARTALEALFHDRPRPEQIADPPAADSGLAGEPSGRSQGFRRKVLSVYDYQCAACGLRINLPGLADGTFIDAAHLIPFSDSRNDHPTNGMALCKNHHWAMDRSLIAPAADGRWRASPRLIPHRSPGERDLAEVSGRQVLLPADDAFHPGRDALDWRCERLLT